MHFKTGFILLFFLSLGIGHPSIAVQPHLKIYNEQNGLNHLKINDIVRDKKGLFWIATNEHIVMFDGVNFIDFSPGFSTFNQEKEVEKLFITGNSLFLIYKNSSCIKLDLKSFEFTKITDIPAIDIYCISSSHFYLLTKSSEILEYHNNRVTKSKQLTGSPGGQINFWKGEILINFPNTGLMAIDSGNFQITRKLPITPGDFSDHFNRGNDVTLFYQKYDSIFQFMPDFSIKNISPSIPESKPEISYYHHYNKYNQFFINYKKNLFRVTNGTTSIIPLGAPDNLELRNIYVVNPEFLLIGTNQGLITLKLNPPQYENINDNSYDNGSSIRVRRKILENTNKEILLFGHPYTWIYKENKQARRLTDSIFAAYDATYAGNYIFVATEGRGVQKVNPKNGSSTVLNKPPLHPQLQYIAVYFNSETSELIIGGEGALLVRYNLSNEKAQGYSLPFFECTIREIHHDTVNQCYWIGTNSGLLCYNKDFKIIKTFTKSSGMSGNDISDICQRYGANELWIGHENGIDIIDLKTSKIKGRVPPSVFTSTKVAAILEDNAKHIWFSTFDGIVGFNPADSTFIRLSKKNNLLNGEFNYKSACKLSSGKLIFGGLNGYDIIDPTTFRFTRRTNNGTITGVHFFSKHDTVFISGKNIRSNSLRFLTKEEYLRFYISTSDFLNADQYVFEYRLNDGPWIKMANGASFNIINLEPGRYDLNIRAFDEFGSTVRFKPINLIAEEDFYKSRTFFIVLMGISIVLLVLLISSFLKWRTKERLLKEQVAMDLHDEVGTILTRALFISSVNSTSKDMPVLRKQLEEALYSLRVYIHSMNSKTFTVLLLADEIKDMLLTSFKNSNFIHTIQIRNDHDYTIPSHLYRDIKLCMYEIINNTFKHSGGSEIQISFEAFHSELTINIIDNGELKDLQILENKGNGITNLRKRIERNKGSIRFEIPEASHGLHINMNFKLS